MPRIWEIIPGKFANELSRRSVNDTWRGALLKDEDPDFRVGADYAFDALSKAIMENGGAQNSPLPRLGIVSLILTAASLLALAWSAGRFPGSNLPPWIAGILLVAGICLGWRALISAVPRFEKVIIYGSWAVTAALACVVVVPSSNPVLLEMVKLAFVAYCLLWVALCIAMWRRPDYLARLETLDQLKAAFPETLAQDKYLYEAQHLATSIANLRKKKRNGESTDKLLRPYLEAANAPTPKNKILGRASTSRYEALRAMLDRMENE